MNIFGDSRGVPVDSAILLCLLSLLWVGLLASGEEAVLSDSGEERRVSSGNRGDALSSGWTTE